MTSRQLLAAIGQAGDETIIEASQASPRRGVRWLPVAVAAVGAAAILALALLTLPKAEKQAPPGDNKTISGNNTAPIRPEENVPEQTPPETGLPALPVYPEEDVYALAYRLNGETPKIDFPALFEAVLADIDVEEPTIEDYVEANREAYDELMGYGGETLFYSLCTIWPNFGQLEDDDITGTDLAYFIVYERLHENEYFEPVLRGENRRHNYIMLFRVIGPRYWSGGSEWLREQPDEVYEVIRAIVSIPELRLGNTVPTGDIINEQVYINAICRGLVWAFMYGGTDKELPLQNETLPAPPENVCNEFTVWELVQEEDQSIAVTFTDSTTGAFKGRMRYIPTEAEKNEDVYAPAEGTIQVEYPE